MWLFILWLNKDFKTKNIANPSGQDNGQSQVTSSNSSSLSFIVLVLNGTPWSTSLFTSFTILLWSVRDTGLNPVEAKFFFQASSLKILELPLPCEGPLFTWMSFVWQPRFIYLKKKIVTLLCVEESEVPENRTQWPRAALNLDVLFRSLVL